MLMLVLVCVLTMLLLLLLLVPLIRNDAIHHLVQHSLAGLETLVLGCRHPQRWMQHAASHVSTELEAVLQRLSL